MSFASNSSAPFWMLVFSLAVWRACCAAAAAASRSSMAVVTVASPGVGVGNDALPISAATIWRALAIFSARDSRVKFSRILAMRIAPLVGGHLGREYPG